MSNNKKDKPEKEPTFTGAVQESSSDDWAPGRREYIAKSSRDEKD